MLNLIKRLIAFLLPILGKAALQTTADVVTNIAYPDKKVRTRSGAVYNYYAPKTAEDQDENERRRIDAVREYAKRDVKMTTDIFENKDRYHDVLMVAFDITGPNMQAVHEWLYNQMPSPTDTDAEIYLDAWWIADDDATDSDCDSAIFVEKGQQQKARGILRRLGLSR